MGHLILPLAVIVLTMIVLGWLLVCIRKFLAVRAQIDAESAPQPKAAPVVQLAPRQRVSMAVAAE